jgi:MFS family permease
MNAYLLCSAAVASLGCLLFGFNAAVIAGVTKALAGVYRLSPATLGVTVSSALWGALLGSAVALRYGGRIGRRVPLHVLAVLSAVSTAGCTFAWSWQSLAVFRLIGGMALGGLSVIGAMYIAEIAPDRMRGKLVALVHFNVTLGIALAYCGNYLVGLGGFGAAEWRWKLGVASALAYLFFFALSFIPESPSWLLRRARPQDARGC